MQEAGRIALEDLFNGLKQQLGIRGSLFDMVFDVETWNF